MPADNKLVIIVEDEPDTAEMFAELMRLEGLYRRMLSSLESPT